MKSKEEIEQLAANLANPNACKTTNWIEGYTQCQQDMQPLLNDLFSLWQSLAEVGEISVGKNFTKKYEELKNSLNKQDNENTRRNRKGS